MSRTEAPLLSFFAESVARFVGSRRTKQKTKKKQVTINKKKSPSRATKANDNRFPTAPFSLGTENNKTTNTDDIRNSRYSKTFPSATMENKQVIIR